MPDSCSARFDGRLKSWNDPRGFGFIEPLQGGGDLFVHIKSFPPGTGRPTVGCLLSFEVEQAAPGKKRATAIRFAMPARRPPARRAETPARWTLVRALAIPAFVALYAYATRAWLVGPWIAAVYLGVSLLTFVVYAIDKSAARHGRWRTPESTLHALALAGGWPGALLAQQLLRHKSTKPTFIAAYWVTVVLNVAGFTLVSWRLLA